ncbi:hypothetical protein [Algoriphagus sp. NG3]|nr:hypothetical protein [Algoriphagus sp. NG3]WPR77043.1 hypothetical protein SLW71_06775 [Algoriphagus sp. NG3]
MNTKKVFYLLILLALIYNMALIFSGSPENSEEETKVTLDIKYNLVDER